MSTGNYDLQINWPNGRHSSAGTITDEQWGEVARILSPDWEGNVDHIEQGLGMVDKNSAAQSAPAGEREAWTASKPTEPGAYWVRGNGLEADALVQVKLDDGELWCNLHMRTTEPDFGYGYSIEQLSDDFEWLGPLHVGAAQQRTQAAGVPEGWKLVPDYADADEIVTALYRRFKDWSARGFSADDVTWCEVKADVLAMLAAAPAQPEAQRLREALERAETYVQTAFSRAQSKDRLGRKLPADHPISVDLALVQAALAASTGQETNP